jgi:hypothetical protein
LGLPLVAPHPQHAPGTSTFDMWTTDMSLSAGHETNGAHGFSDALALGSQHMDAPRMSMGMAEFDTLFDGSFTEMHAGGMDSFEF